MIKILKYSTVLASAYYAVLYPSHVVFGVLIIVNVIDYITGILKAVSYGEAISPHLAFSGFVKKVNKLFYVMVALSVDILITYNFTPDKAVSPVSTAVITWMVINELVSICSNISNNDALDIPPAIMNFLGKFKDN